MQNFELVAIALKSLVYCCIAKCAQHFNHRLRARICNLQVGGGDTESGMAS